MRVVFLGTPQFAVPSLRGLMHCPDFEVVGVTTQPDRRAGRGQKLAVSPVKSVAQSAGIPVYQPEKIRGNDAALDWLDACRPDLMVVVAFGQILPEPFFSRPPFGTINVHASILPAYRGAAPIAHAILNGESETGVTIMKIDVGMDTGDMLAWSKVPIGPEMSSGDLEVILAEVGATLLLPTLKDFVKGLIEPVPQAGELATYAPRIVKSDGRIDWKEPVARIHDRIRAMNPWPVAFALLKGEEVRLWRARIGRPQGAEHHAGTLLEFREDALEIQCGMGTLLVSELQLPNRRRMSARDFVNGTHARRGDRFE